MAMQRMGISPESDIQVASHSVLNSPALLGWEDKLIRLEFNLDEIVQGMFRTLETLMVGHAPEGFIPVPANPDCPHYVPPECVLVMHPTLIRPIQPSGEIKNDKTLHPCN